MREYGVKKTVEEKPVQQNSWMNRHKYMLFSYLPFYSIHHFFFQNIWQLLPFPGFLETQASWEERPILGIYVTRLVIRRIKFDRESFYRNTKDIYEDFYAPPSVKSWLAAASENIGRSCGKNSWTVQPRNESVVILLFLEPSEFSKTHEWTCTSSCFEGTSQGLKGKD